MLSSKQKWKRSTTALAVSLVDIRDTHQKMAADQAKVVEGIQTMVKGTARVAWGVTEEGTIKSRGGKHRIEVKEEMRYSE